MIFWRLGSLAEKANLVPTCHHPNRTPEQVISWLLFLRASGSYALSFEVKVFPSKFASLRWDRCAFYSTVSRWSSIEYNSGQSFRICGPAVAAAVVGGTEDGPVQWSFARKRASPHLAQMEFCVLTHLPAACKARFSTGCGLVPGHSQGLGTPGV